MGRYNTAMAKQHLLWIDGVGGFLLGMEFPLALGNAQAQPLPDVPLQACLGRRHASIDVGAEGFVLVRGEGQVSVSGKPLGQSLLLADRARIQLDEYCDLEFRQSVPGSGAGRLEILRGARLLYPIRTALLFTEGFTFAPAPRDGDGVIPGLRQSVTLFRTRQGLELRRKSPTGGVTKHPLEPGKPAFLPDLCVTWEVVG